MAINPGVLVLGIWRTVRPPEKADDERQDVHEWRIGSSVLLWLIIVVTLMKMAWNAGLVAVVTFGLLGTNTYVSATELDEVKEEIIASSVARGVERTKQIAELTEDTKANGLGMLEIRIDMLHEKQCAAEAMGNTQAVVLIAEIIRDKQTDYALKSGEGAFDLLPCL